MTCSGADIANLQAGGKTNALDMSASMRRRLIIIEMAPQLALSTYARQGWRTEPA